MASIKLFYFNSRGRAEVLRLLLVTSGVEWEDIRFSWEEWSKFQPDAPFGQAPYLLYNGKTMSQGIAIANFLAKEFGFYGKTNLDALRIDEVIYLIQDLINCELKVYFEKDETKKAELLQKLKTEDIPKFFGFFQKLLKESGTGYFVGDKMTVADLAVYDRIVSMKEMWKIVDVHEGYPELKELCKRVEEQPNIHKYLEEQKVKTQA